MTWPKALKPIMAAPDSSTVGLAMGLAGSKRKGPEAASGTKREATAGAASRETAARMLLLGARAKGVWLKELKGPGTPVRSV